MTRRPHHIVVCVDRFDAPQGRIWAVRDGHQWLTAKCVRILIEMQTVFKGIDARQPKAYLAGVGVAHLAGDTITIRER